MQEGCCKPRLNLTRREEELKGKTRGQKVKRRKENELATVQKKENEISGQWQTSCNNKVQKEIRKL